MTRLKGKVISRPLTVVPLQGAQVIRYRKNIMTAPLIETVRQVNMNEILFKSGGFQYNLEFLYELCVQYPNPEQTLIAAYRVPLKYSQWQPAIDAGEVDSDREVEFELVDRASNFDGTITRIARIIPAKPVTEDWDYIETKWEQFVIENDVPDLSFMSWLKEHYNPPIKIKQ